MQAWINSFQTSMRVAGSNQFHSLGRWIHCVRAWGIIKIWRIQKWLGISPNVNSYRVKQTPKKYQINIWKNGGHGMNHTSNCIHLPMWGVELGPWHFPWPRHSRGWTSPKLAVDPRPSDTSAPNDPCQFFCRPHGQSIASCTVGSRGKPSLLSGWTPACTGNIFEMDC